MNSSASCAVKSVNKDVVEGNKYEYFVRQFPQIKYDKFVECIKNEN